MIGQCHRYSEYEISPMKTTGREASREPTSDDPVSPAAMIRTAPRQGSVAASPGKGVPAL